LADEALVDFKLDKRGWTKIVTTSSTFAMRSSAESEIAWLPLVNFESSFQGWWC